MARIWDFFEKNRQNVEGIDRIWDAIMNLEYQVERMTGAPLSAIRAARKAAEEGEK